MNNHRKQQLLYLIADILSAIAVWVCFLIVRWLVYNERGGNLLIPAFTFYRPLIIYPIFCVVVYYLSGFYMRPMEKSVGKIVGPTLASAVFISLTAFFVIVIDDEVQNARAYIWSLLILFGLQTLWSLVPRLMIGRLTRSSVTRQEYTIRSLKQVDDFVSAHRLNPYDRVVIDLKRNGNEQDLYTIIGLLYPHHVDIAVEPKLIDLLTGAARISDVCSRPLIEINELKMSDTALCIKRGFDIVFSVVMMAVLSPLYLLLTILVKMSSPGPVLFRQERIGKHGVPFEIIKFRTMLPNSEGDVPQLTLDDDPRVTPLGRVMRKYRLDELPQLWNVLCGDMSVVGPRPERRYFIDKISQKAPYYCLLYKVRPGLTSWGPIRVGYTDTLEKMIDRLNYDIAYTENMSIALDLKIMFYTISVIVDGKGK